MCDPVASVTLAAAGLPGEVTVAFEALYGRQVLQERRTGQLEMAGAVAAAIDGAQHLLVRAGTGVGKTLAYLVPAVLSGQRVVVATATRSLQEQIAARDLPWLCEALDRPVTFTVLKGRSNYLCRQRMQEAITGNSPSPPSDEYRRLVEWAADTVTGDRDELPFEPSERTWRLVSVRSDECPGKARCPSGTTCFAELARESAADSDVVVTNHHVYATGLLASHQLLPEHRVVVFDEAHQVDEVIRQATATRVDPVRVTRVVGTATDGPDGPPEELIDALARLRSTLTPLVGTYTGRVPADVAQALAGAGELVRQHAALCRSLARRGGGHRWQRVAYTCALVAENMALPLADSARVVWVEGLAARPVLRSIAPSVDTSFAFGDPTRRVVIFTSATVGPEVPKELGFAADSVRRLDVASPFSYLDQAMLYCAADIPDPRAPGWSGAAHEELAALIAAAGGRTLALFTSWDALHAAVAAVAPQLDMAVLVQGAVGKRELLERFRDDPTSCVFATVSLAQGTDIPGDSLTLVTIDRVPFPPAHDPYLAARRAAKGPRAFRDVDLRHARTVLAQTAGRLIRTQVDRGVFAVLDPRLATANYRWDLVRSIPPMRRTRDRSVACAFLQSCTQHIE